MKKSILCLSLFLFFPIFMFAQSIEVIHIKGKGSIFSKQLNRDVKPKDKLSLTSALKFSDKNTVLVGIKEGKINYVTIDQKNMKVNTFYKVNELTLPAGKTRNIMTSICHIFTGVDCDSSPKPLILFPNLKIELPENYTLKDRMTYELQYKDESLKIKNENDNILVFDDYIYKTENKTYPPSEITAMNVVIFNKNNNTSQKIKILPLWIEKSEIKSISEGFKQNFKKEEVIKNMLNFLNTFYGHISESSLKIWIEEN